MVLDSIISDLKQAQRLLAYYYNDTLYNYKMMESASMRFDGNVTGTALGGDFCIPGNSYELCCSDGLAS